MAVRLCLTALSDSCDFSDRILESDDDVDVGRADTQHRADVDNAFFNCKVLSKRHAKLIMKGSRVYLQDRGSTNGSFINKFRLSRPGKPSRMREIFTGDIVQFGNIVTSIAPVIAKVTITDLETGVTLAKRSRNSIVFTPAESQEDITVDSSDCDDHDELVANNDDNEEECQMSKESLLLLKEKILEMQKGMEYLSIKERDYEDLQNLAEEEAETICQLEKENYKLKLALSSIESRISHEKEKYIKLAECEAETICNLEKENFSLSHLLSKAEAALHDEREKYKVLENTHKNCENQLLESIQNQTNTNKELLQVQSQLLEARKQVAETQKENENLRMQERIAEATESDLDMIMKETLKVENQGFIEVKQTEKVEKVPRNTTLDILHLYQL